MESDKKIVLSNTVDDFQIEIAERTPEFKMNSFHYHPYYEIYYVVSGSSKAFIDHSIYHANEGDFILLPPTSIHKFVYDTNQNVKRYTLFFSQKYIREIYPEHTDDILSNLFRYPVLHLTTLLQNQTQELLEAMHQESQVRDSFSDANCKSYIALLLSALGRNKNEIQIQNLDSMENAIQASARYIYNHFRENITLEDAAGSVHMSTTYYSKKFKKITGLGFKEYLTKIRLYEASELLKSTKLNITKIAIDCGFSDGNYFGDAFRKEYGISPRDYRKNGLSH